MSNYDSLSLYLVSEGDVMPADSNTEWDGNNSILVAATSPESALQVAMSYDKGEIQADNLQWNGETIAAVFVRVDGRYL